MWLQYTLFCFIPFLSNPSNGDSLAEKNKFCESNPCHNGGQCIVMQQSLALKDMEKSHRTQTNLFISKRDDLTLNEANVYCKNYNSSLYSGTVSGFVIANNYLTTLDTSLVNNGFWTSLRRKSDKTLNEVFCYALEQVDNYFVDQERLCESNSHAALCQKNLKG